MASYNKVILVGNLTRDPELKFLPNQTAVADFGLAVNRKWKDKEETCFVDCTAFGKQAETLKQYMTKGRPILIEGRLQFDQWEAKDGTKHSKHKVIVEGFQFLGDQGKPQDKPPAMPAEAPGMPPQKLPEGPADFDPNDKLPY